MNFKNRLKNEAWWLGIIPCAIAFITALAMLFGYEIDLSIWGERITAVIVAGFALLAALGVSVDTSTKGFYDNVYEEDIPEDEEEE